jgi:lipoprotein-anchoring transpeptidase ErfK/SrfK
VGSDEREMALSASVRSTSARRRTRSAAAAVASVVTVALAAGTWAAGAAAASAAEPSPAGTPAPAPAGTAPTPSATPAPAPTHVVLSNERTFTTWAHALEEAPIRARPVLGSRTLARTHLATEDGFPEVYLLLSSFTDAHGREWIQVRIPGRPNGRTGWVTRATLSELRVTHWLVEIVRSARRLKAYYDGHLRFSAPVGVGKPSTPTPAGHFYIREIFKVSRSNAYWPYAIGTSDYSTLTDWPGGGVVGIHGDLGQPRLIPGAPSHGCVRMRTRDLARLVPRLTLGTPVHIV